MAEFLLKFLPLVLQFWIIPENYLSKKMRMAKTLCLKAGEWNKVHRIIRDFLVQLCSNIKYNCPDNGLKSCSCETSLCRQFRSWELPVQTDRGIHVQFCTFCTLYMGPETNDPTLKHLCCRERHKWKSRRGQHREFMWLFCKNIISLMFHLLLHHFHLNFHVLSKLLLTIWFYHEQAFHEVRFNIFFVCFHLGIQHTFWRLLLTYSSA